MPGQDGTRRWEPPPEAASLVGPGGPFELVEEDVLGVPTTVFATRPPNLVAVLTAAAEAAPTLDHLVFPDRVLRFADVVASAGRIASYLAREHGVGPGDRVALAAANVPVHPVAWWATISLGAIATGLNGWWTSAEFAHGVGLARPKVVLADAPRLRRLRRARLPSGLALVDMATLEPLLGAPRSDDPGLPDAQIDEDDPLAILFTSGTTGRAKGATISHRSFVHCPMVMMLSAALSMGPAPGEAASGQAASLLPAPLFHVSGTLPLASAPAFRSKIVFPPTGAWDEETHLRLTEEHRITAWSAVPTQLWRILEHERFDRYDTSSVGSIGGGGAVMPPELLRLVQRKMPWATVGGFYGMTETLGSGTRLTGATLETHPSSVGTVEPLCEVQLRDEHGGAVADGDIGEICIRGASVFLGYWDDPDATAKVLDGRRWYRTGDYGRFADDLLYVESRMRDLIIRGGENIYPIEIENRLVEHPAIAEACVVGVPHRELGQEVAAVVVPRGNATIVPDEVRAWVGDELAAFKVPAFVIIRADLPSTSTGKVQKHLVETYVAEELAARGDAASDS